jgi:hypothetical protein
LTDSPPAHPARAALADWRLFASGIYRPFRLLAVAQGFIGPGSARFVASRMTEISPRDPVRTLASLRKQ